MPNRLARASSPYLLQHRDNPVDWWEWSPEAFEEARKRDVPVLLSVGYAACHWCHVMAHESFEDPETARLMNGRFVNIKVDREERPDVDSIYMEAVQTMTGQGGWPMTVWLDPDGRPFFAGTYFPKNPMHGMASFRQVIEAVSDAWEQRRADVGEQAHRLLDAIKRDLPAGSTPTEESLASAFRLIEGSYDPGNGGFGTAPKFPQQPVLEFLLRVHGEDWAGGARSMLTKTLENMAAGGIHDQVGGGFARYSVDDHWLVPHFEKMLYDNAQLARLYLWAGVEFGRDDFIDVARSTLDYLIRDLRHPDGGFYSSEDADSEGEEGKFYVWRREELESVLGDRAEDAAAYFGVTDHGNFEGSNILHVAGEEPPPDLDAIKERLLTARAERVRPGLDDKVVTSWNGLAILALAEAGAVLRDDGYLRAARQAADFVLTNLVVDGTLMRSWREGRTSVPGFLDDHAALAVGLFRLYAATSETRWYQTALDLVSRLDRFSKPGGGFYSTSDDSPELVKRPSDVTDNPLPSGSALAAEALLLAGLYTGEHPWSRIVDETLASVGLLVDRYPTMVGHHLAVAHSAMRSRELAIVGPAWDRLAKVYWSRYRPEIALAPSATGDEPVPLFEGRAARDGETLAYLCRGFVCDLPTSEPEQLERQLAGVSATPPPAP
jgi:uncharacterized protein YyaL (SSP411 family)